MEVRHWFKKSFPKDQKSGGSSLWPLDWQSSSKNARRIAAVGEGVVISSWCHNDAKLCQYVICIISMIIPICLPVLSTCKNGCQPSIQSEAIPIWHCSTVARYSVMCKVNTPYHATSKIKHGWSTCMVDNQFSKVDYISVQTDKPDDALSLS